MNLLKSFLNPEARGGSPVRCCSQRLFSRKDQKDGDINENRYDEDDDEDCAKDAWKDNILYVTTINNNLRLKVFMYFL